MSGASPAPANPVPGRPGVAIIGAGIGGLTLAAFLTAAGIGCRVFEQARRLSPVGAGLQLAPNAVRLLHRLGLRDRLIGRAVRPSSIELRGWDDDRLLARTTLGARCEELYGAPYYTIHRADLHAALAERLAPGVLRLGHRLRSIEERSDRIVLSFADGTVADADVVVGADGIRSVVRQSVSADEPVFSGHAVYRGLVPGSEVPALVAEPAVRVWLGPGQHCVCYPVSGGSAVSFAATVPSDDSGAESWTAEASVADLAAAYARWSRPVAQLIGAARAVRRWTLYDREPLSRWTAGRRTVLGDAAHPMLPFLAQGANQAIEDAAVLAACLVRGTTDPTGALRRYETLRIPRTAAVQRGSRLGTRVLHEPGNRSGAGQLTGTEDDHGGGEVALRKMAWLYGYDPFVALAR